MDIEADISRPTIICQLLRTSQSNTKSHNRSHFWIFHFLAINNCEELKSHSIESQLRVLYQPHSDSNYRPF
jgi:hypothetical protein